VQSTSTFVFSLVYLKTLGVMTRRKLIILSPVEGFCAAFDGRIAYTLLKRYVLPGTGRVTVPCHRHARDQVVR